ncbi:MAG: hypothetical protein IPP17_30650 [Bacteroidetes bacterium]|nr:hypothetical protein [Bacteroidota bacterium]
MPVSKSRRLPISHVSGDSFCGPGELRNNHFHSGIDIKTGGGIGQPLLAVHDGYIYRIKVSPFGFGKPFTCATPMANFPSMVT